MAPITSFIRWAGGKSWLVPYVAQLTEKLEYNNYYEHLITIQNILSINFCTKKITIN